VASAWGERGARINCISPGVVSTAMGRLELSGESGGLIQTMVDNSGLRRIGTPEDIAAATEFLLGPMAAFITGTDLLVDGGVIAAVRSGTIDLAQAPTGGLA
jgi:NAD(P)-dependent dehydrogenase (short-subunit alcohol dehydrogenase family)